jgi:hypothetical protein
MRSSYNASFVQTYFEGAFPLRYLQALSPKGKSPGVPVAILFCGSSMFDSDDDARLSVALGLPRRPYHAKDHCRVGRVGRATGPKYRH